ncbi:tandem-95 repeat protein [Psychromonas sp.]|uniref:tandem-95 repeat protein n=1 Tax=Psychromonas sp. TaxID=1884585 RepID=UPI00356413A2
MTYITTNDVENVSDYALLANAVYKDSVVNGSSFTTESLTVDEPSSDGTKRSYFSAELAEELGGKYTYVDSMNDPFSDFQAILLQEDGTNKFVIAIRGTEPSLLDAIADAQINTEGVAFDQVVSMKLFIDRIKEDLPENAVLDVTGHSLGGHLATILMGMEPELINEIYTWNGVGVIDTPLGALNRLLEDLENTFGEGDKSDAAQYIVDNYAQIISDLQSSTTQNRITNYVVGGDVVSEIGTNYSSSGETFIYTETENEGPDDSHSINSITDALLLQELIANIDASIVYTDMVSIIKAASNQLEGSLESTLKTISALFGTTYSGGIVIDDNTDDRYEYQAAILELQVPINSFTGLKIVDVASLVSAAELDTTDGYAYRYALTTLSTFAITGDENLYDTHNENGKLDAENFSENYLNDRAELLAYIIERNLNDSPDYYAFESDENRLYRDLKTDTTLVTYNADGYQSDDTAARTTFGTGTEGADTTLLDGGAKDDHLYGAGGNDIIHGNAGDDIIEGNADHDTLYGEAGQDYLYGGKGNDHLHGGADLDFLFGGKGDDTYYFNTGDGQDLVMDYAGNNKLMINGDPITNITQVANDFSIYEDENKNRYVLTEGTLVISLLSGEALTIDDFDKTTNNFGLTLNDAIAEELPNNSGDEYIVGDGTYIDSNGDEQVLDNLYEERNADAEQAFVNDKSIIYDQALAEEMNLGTMHLFSGGNLGDQLTGGDFTDQLHGYGGDDYLSGGGAVDFLVGNLGDDKLLGGEGGDFLAGNELWIYDENGLIRSNYVAEDVSSRDYLDGGNGNDMINGDEGDDIILGGAGDDEIGGGAGADSIEGGADNDIIYGDSRWQVFYVEGTTYAAYRDYMNAADGLVNYNDVINGGAGDDHILGEIGDDLIYGGVGSDWIMGDRNWLDNIYIFDGVINPDYISLDATLHGDDIIYGGDGDDLLSGNAGNDVIYGGNDDDGIWGDETNLPGEYHGNDTLSGGTGEDYIVGGGGDDTIDGGAENDDIRGDNIELAGEYHGNDILLGGEGNDQLIGGGGEDVIDGGTDNDIIWGDDPRLDGKYHGNDNILGGAGDDQLIGGGGDDIIDGGADNDLILGDADTLGGAYHGNDTLSGGAGNDEIRGGGGDDVINGSFGDDLIWGDRTALDSTYHGKDTLSGGAGEDQIIAGSGDDIINGGTDNDSLYGEAGNDTYIYSLGDGNDYIEDTEGDNTLTLDFNLSDISSYRKYETYGVIHISNGESIRFSLASISTFNIIFSDGSPLAINDLDQISYLSESFTEITTGAGNDSVSGSVSDDTIITGSGDDTLRGYAGNDNLSGGTGEDYIVGGEGGDVISGDADNDKIWGDSSSVDGASHGSDNLSGGTGDDYIVGGGADDTIDGGADNDKIWGDSSSIDDAYHGNDNILGGAGNDEIYGGGGDDVIDGGADNDKIWGDSSNVDGAYHGKDTLSGGTGEDYIVGGGADDVITGGADNDQIWGDSSSLDSVYHGNDNLSGGAGDDIIQGQGGDDVIDGGAGDDLLSGGAGNDQINGGLGFNLIGIDDNDGHDIINVTAGGSDSILFGEGVTEDRLTFSQEGDDLLIKIDEGSSQSVVVVDHFKATEFALNYVQFSGGSMILASTINDIISGDSSGGDFDSVVEGDDLDNSLQGDNNDNLIKGHGGNDTLDGGNGNDTLQGGAGTDYLEGGTGDDILSGGSGSNDSLSGDEGNDIYLFSAGDGHTTILNNDTSTGYDVLRFDDSVVVSDVTAIRYFDYLLLTLASTGEFITVDDHFTNSSYALNAVEFADGTVWDENKLKTLVLDPTEGDDYIIGYESDDLLNGLGGDDYLRGGDGDDTLQGGAGSDEIFGDDGNDILSAGSGDGDFLVGGDGNDIYLFSTSEGDTTIENVSYDTDYDVLHFDDSVVVSDVIATRSIDHLLLTLASTGKVITVRNHFSSSNHALNAVEFADGTVWNEDKLKMQALVPTEGDDYIIGYESDDLLNGLGGDDYLQGGDGNDTIQGGAGSDYLSGGSGNDILSGGSGGDDSLRGEDGNDIYLFSAGEGNTNIWNNDNLGEDSHDVLRFDDSVLASDVTRLRSGNDLLLTLTSTGEVITVLSHFESSSYALNAVEFADGTKWDTVLFNIEQVATEGDDTIYGDASDDVINGLGGNDRLFGSEGDDIISGDAGDDRLSGDAGNDSLQGGEGIDYIAGGNGNDILSGDAGDDSIYGSYGNDILQGGSGNDVLEGGNGDDILSGGTGSDLFGKSDILSGNEGNDIYLFSAGDGDTMINNFDGSDRAGATYDVLRFDSSVLASDVTVSKGSRSGFPYLYTHDNLMLTVESTGEVITAIYHFYASSYMLDAIEFADGTVWDIATIAAKAAGVEIINKSIVEDGKLIISFAEILANATGENLTIDSVSNALNGVVTINQLTSEVEFTPDADFNGTASFDYLLSDGEKTIPFFVAIAVTPENHTPVVTPDLFDAVEDQPLVMTFASLLVNDSDIDADTFNIVSVADAVNGDVSIDLVAETITFTPDSDFNGVASFNYSVSDGTETVTAGVTLNVAAVNDVPVVNPDLFAAVEDQPVVMTFASLLANDSDIDADLFNIVSVADAVNGDVTIDLVAETITFTPDSDFNGVASFNYSVSDGIDTVIAGVTLNVSAVNDAPVVNPDLFAAVEDQPLVMTFASLLANDSDIDADLFNIVSVADAVNGDVTIDMVAETITFTPDSDFSGVASFNYSVSDGIETVIAGVTLNVSAVNDAPVVNVGLFELSLDADAPLHFVIPDDAFSDVDGDQLKYTALLSDGSPLPDWLTFDGKIFSGVPSDGDAGVYDLSVVANDGEKSVNANFKLTVDDNGGLDSVFEGDGLDNTLLGDNNANLIKGYGGNDTLRSNGGNDTLQGGGGNDLLYGGSNNDILNGGKGVDLLIGGSGDDNLSGGNDDDTLKGGSGDDKLKGGGGEDLLFGGAGDDALFGNAGNDRLKAGVGNDILKGNRGNDYLVGGKGNDRYKFSIGDGQDTINNFSNIADETDQLILGTGIVKDDLWFTRSGEDLVIDLSGSVDQVTVDNWFVSDAHQVDEIHVSDAVLLSSNVDALISAMSGFDNPAVGNMDIPQQVKDEIAPVIVAAWQLS